MAGILGMLAQGFANAGENVAKFASDAATIQMKADLEKQSMQLANQLQTERELTVGAQSNAAALARAKLEQEGATGRTNIEQSGALQRTNIEQSGAAARTATEQAGALSRTQLEQSGAAERTAAEIAGRHEDVQAQIKAESARLSQQLAVQGNELGFAADGSAVITNKVNGKVTPVKDKDGNPVQLQNPAQAQAYTQLLKNSQDDMRYLTQQRGQAQGEVDRLQLPGMAESPELKKAKAAVADIDAQIAQARDTTASITQAMMQHARVRATSGPAVGEIIQGYRFKGGDPNLKSNWEPVQ